MFGLGDVAPCSELNATAHDPELEFMDQPAVATCDPMQLRR
jgi:hypothetical protein